MNSSCAKRIFLEYLNGTTHMVLEVWLCQFAKSPESTYLFELLHHSVLPFTSSSERGGCNDCFPLLLSLSLNLCSPTSNFTTH